MTRFFTLTFLLLFAAPVLADEPMFPPAIWETCSPSQEYCARLDPEANSVTAFRKDTEHTVLWTAPGWSRVAGLADDGVHFVMGWEGMNLIPLDYDKNMPMLTFFRRGKQFAVVRLRDLAGWLNLQRTVSHYYWGDYYGFDGNGHYVVKISRGSKIRFDMTTGQRVD